MRLKTGESQRNETLETLILFQSYCGLGYPGVLERWKFFHDTINILCRNDLFLVVRNVLILQQAYGFICFQPNMTVMEVEMDTKMSISSASNLHRSHSRPVSELLLTLEGRHQISRRVPSRRNTSCPTHLMPPYKEVCQTNL